jgi:uncharacterized protein
MDSMVIPGIYVSEQQYALNSLQIDTRCLAAFAGITERGPLNEPVLLKNFDSYLKYFGGFDTAGVLPCAVYNYFRCGGAECLVVRVANTASARPASATLKCQEGSIIVEAASPGHWGNYITVRIWNEYEKLSGAISEFDTVNGLWIAGSCSGPESGDVLQFNFSGNLVYRSVARTERDRIYLTVPLSELKNGTEKQNQIPVARTFFSMTVSCRGVSENYLHLSGNPESDRFFETYVNARSSLCRIRGDHNGGLVYPVFARVASGGSDGIADMSAGCFIGRYEGPGQYAGLGCFESRDDISLIAVPDASWLLSVAGLPHEKRLNSVYAVQRALVEQAERFPGRFAVLDIPSGFDIEQATGWAKKLDSACASAYYPEIDMLDPLDPVGARTVRVPPSGAVCGCIVATDSEKGIFHAPANCVLQGTAGLAVNLKEGEQELIFAAGVNLLRYFPGRGIKIWGARTLSSDPDWRYINVRRTFSRITSAIKQGTQWAVFEVNDKNLRKRLVRQVSGFLLDLWMKGYLAGSTAEQGFYVRCDDELNPPENIDNGILTFEVGIAIVRPVEFFKIQITAEKDGASVYIQDKQ